MFPKTEQEIASYIMSPITYETRDYKKLSLLEYNRPIDMKIVNKMINIMKNDNKFNVNPMKVTKDLLIIDGQHRFLAAKELKLPVYFIIDYQFKLTDLVSIQTVQTRWRLNDYLNLYNKLENENYKKFSDLCTMINFTANNLVTWVCKKTDEVNFEKSRSGDFKNGKFIYDVNDNLLKALFTASEILSILKKIDFKPALTLHQREFHLSLRTFLLSPYVNHKEFIKKITTFPNLMKHKTTNREYISLLVDIYNHSRHSKKIIVNFDNANRALISE